jgi:phage-related holin
MPTWAKATGLALLAVFAPVKAVLATVLALMLIDLVTGVWAAKKRGEAIRSAALRRSVSKLLVFELVVIAAHIFDAYILGTSWLVKAAAGAIGLVEMKSVLENANAITAIS